MNSKAVQYMTILIFTLSMVVVDTMVGGWWVSTVFFAVLLTLPLLGVVEWVCQASIWYSGGRDVDGVCVECGAEPYYGHLNGCYYAKGTLSIGDKVDWDDADTYVQVTPSREVVPAGALLKVRPYNWEAEMFHTKDEEEIYISTCHEDSIW